MFAFILHHVLLERARELSSIASVPVPIVTGTDCIEVIAPIVGGVSDSFCQKSFLWDISFDCLVMSPKNFEWNTDQKNLLISTPNRVFFDILLRYLEERERSSSGVGGGWWHKNIEGKKSVVCQFKRDRFVLFHVRRNIKIWRHPSFDRTRRAACERGAWEARGRIGGVGADHSRVRPGAPGREDPASPGRCLKSAKKQGTM
jgi:hypothetical protein